MSVSAVIDKKMLRAVKKEGLSLEEKQEILAGCGLLYKEDGYVVDAGACMALECWLKARYAVECVGEKTDGSIKNTGFYVGNMGITMTREDDERCRLLYLPSLKLAIGALADVLWDCGTGEETQIDHRDQGAENDQDVKRIFKENHDIFPESSGPRIHISCRDGSGIKSRFIIESIHGWPWLCQYDRTRIQWGYFTRPDLVNMVGSWLIRFQRQAILEAAKGEVDRDEH